MNQVELCQLDDIRDGGSKEFYPNGEALFAVRRGDNVFVYRNSCPHTGLPLNWAPDQFFNLEKTYIQCSVHAAIFQPDTGYCVAGPCSGDSLESISSKVTDGTVTIRLPDNQEISQ